MFIRRDVNTKSVGKLSIFSFHASPKDVSDDRIEVGHRGLKRLVTMGWLWDSPCLGGRLNQSFQARNMDWLTMVSFRFI